jgi:hypothetical protein
MTAEVAGCRTNLDAVIGIVNRSCTRRLPWLRLALGSVKLRVTAGEQGAGAACCLCYMRSTDSRFSNSCPEILAGLSQKKPARATHKYRCRELSKKLANIR